MALVKPGGSGQANKVAVPKPTSPGQRALRGGSGHDDATSRGNSNRHPTGGVPRAEAPPNFKQCPEPSHTSGGGGPGVRKLGGPLGTS